MIIGLSGYAQSGKDTAAELLCLNYGYTRRAFADPMREALLRLNPKIDSITHVSHLVDDYGWDIAKKNPEVRRLLQHMGTEVGRSMFGENFWVDRTFAGLKSEDKVVISDVRFPNEADAIKAMGGVVWRIIRKSVDAVNPHPSEHAMKNYEFEHTIYNHNSLDDFADEIFMSAKKYNL